MPDNADATAEAIGWDSQPTNKLRVRHISETRIILEQEWIGSRGSTWIPVPNVDAEGEPISLSIEGRRGVAP